MKYLVDTGVLLRLFDSADPHCRDIRVALKACRSRKDELFFAHQNAAEFWNVSTRPASARGGYGHDIERVRLRLEFLERFAGRASETQKSYDVWKKLLVDHSVSGVGVHDARLVSVMICSGIRHIITLNGRDFARYPEVTAVTPAALVGASP